MSWFSKQSFPKPVMGFCIYSIFFTYILNINSEHLHLIQLIVPIYRFIIQPTATPLINKPRRYHLTIQLSRHINAIYRTIACKTFGSYSLQRFYFLAQQLVQLSLHWMSILGPIVTGSGWRNVKRRELFEGTRVFPPQV